MKSHIITFFLISGIVIIGALPTFVQFGNYIFWSDYLQQVIPFVAETKRLLSSGTPFWSWNTYLGQNYIGAYGFYPLTSPFAWVNCLFPDDWLIQSLFLMLILKCVCAYYTAYMYFRRMKITKNNSKIGGLLYTFSSFAITNIYYYSFYEPIILFPILLIAIERFLNNERYSFFYLIIASFLVTFINFYFAICSLLFALIYTICRIPSLENHLSANKLLKGVICVIIGVLLDAAILFPVLSKMMESPRAGIGQDPLYNVIPYLLERLRNLVMPQVFEGPNSIFVCTGWNSTSICIPIFGVFAASMYYLKHPKKWHSVLLLVSLLLYLTPLNGIFSAFTNVNYTRWGYALCLIIILLSVKYLDENTRIKKRYLFTYLFVSYIIYYLAIDRKSVELFDESRKILKACYLSVFVLNILCLTLYSKIRSHKLLVVFIFLCASFQMAIFHTLRTDVYKDYALRSHSITDTSKYALCNRVYNNCLKKENLPYLSTPAQYRTTFYSEYMNIGLMTNRPCDVSFNSIHNYEAIRFYKTSDTDTTKYLNGITRRHNCNLRSYYALSSVKDIIVYKEFKNDSTLQQLNKSHIEHLNNYDIYRNNDYIPMGFSYDNYVLESTIDSLNDIRPNKDVPLYLLSNLCVKNEDENAFAKYLHKGTINDNENLDSVIAKRRKHAVTSFKGTTYGFVSKVTQEKPNFIFYSVPHEKGFKAFIDDIETNIYEVNLGLSAVFVPKGTHTVTFKFIPNGLYAGIYVSAFIFMIVLVVFYYEKKKTFINS